MVATAGKWERALRPGCSDWEKDDLCEIVYWVRQIVGLLLGLVWGLIPLVGFMGIISFGLANVILCFLYYAKFLKVDVESIGSWDLMVEGFPTSFGLFLVAWICSYSLMHGDSI